MQNSVYGPKILKFFTGSCFFPLSHSKIGTLNQPIPTGRATLGMCPVHHQASAQPASGLRGSVQCAALSVQQGC